MNKKIFTLLAALFLVTSVSFADVEIEQNNGLCFFNVDFTNHDVGFYIYPENMTFCCHYIFSSRSDVEFGFGVGAGLTACGGGLYCSGIVLVELFSSGNFGMQIESAVDVGCVFNPFYPWPPLGYSSVEMGFRFINSEFKKWYSNFSLKLSEYYGWESIDGSLFLNFSVGYRF